MNLSIQEKINSYISTHSELKGKSEQIILSAMVSNGVITQAEYEKACQNSAFGTGFAGKTSAGTALEHSIQTSKNSEIIEDNQKIFEYNDEKLTSIKAKDGSFETTFTYLKNDDGINFVISHTIYSDGTQVTTTALNTDQNTGEINPSDFLNRTTTSPDGTTTILTSEISLSGAIKETIITNDKITTNIYNSTSIEDYDKKDQTPLNRIAQSIETNGHTYNIQYDGDGNTYVILQNGDCLENLKKDFHLTKAQLDELNKGVFAYDNMQVGGRIRVPSEITADDNSVKNRKSQQEALTDFQNWSIKKEYSDLYTCTFSEYTIKSKHNSAESLAREILPNGTKEQIRTLALRLLMINKDLLKNLKPGAKITIAKEGSSQTSNAAKEAGFKPTPENNSFYVRLNSLTDDERKKVLPVLQSFKASKTTDLEVIKLKVFEKTGISLFDSGKTVKSGNKTKPLEVALKEDLGLDITLFNGGVLYDKLSCLNQEDLSKIDFQKVSKTPGFSTDSIQQLYAAFENTGITLYTTEEAESDEHLYKLQSQNFARRIIESQYDQAIAILKQYKDNSGMIAKFYEGFAKGVDKSSNSKQAHSVTGYIEHLQQEKERILKELDNTKLSVGNTQAYRNAFKQSTGVEFSAVDIHNFIKLVEKNADPNSKEYQDAYQKAFGSRLVDATSDFAGKKGFWAGLGNLTLSIYAMMNPIARSATGSIAAGLGRTGLSTLSSQALANAAIMGGSSALVEGLDLAIKDAPISRQDISNYLQSVGISTGFGAFAGYMAPAFQKVCSAVSEKAAEKLPQLFKSPSSKKVAAVTTQLENSPAGISGKDIMATYLTAPGSNFAGKSAEFVTEILAFSGYSLTAGTIAKFAAIAFDKDNTLKSQYNDEASLFELIKQELGHQLEGLTSCKVLTKMLMAFCAKNNTAAAMMSEKLNSFDSLKNIDFKLTEINGQKVLVAQTPNGNFKINSTTEVIKLCQTFMMAENAIKIAAEKSQKSENPNAPEGKPEIKAPEIKREVTEDDKNNLRELLKKSKTPEFSHDWLIETGDVPALIEFLQDPKIQKMKLSSNLLRCITSDNLNICRQLLANKEFSKLNSLDFALRSILMPTNKNNVEFVQQLVNDNMIKPLEAQTWTSLLWNINSDNIEFVKDLYKNNKQFLLIEALRQNNDSQNLNLCLHCITDKNIELAKEFAKSENLTIEKLLNITRLTSDKLSTFDGKVKTELVKQISELTDTDKALLKKYGFDIERISDTLSGHTPSIKVEKNQQMKFVEQIIANNNPQSTKVLSEFDFAQYGKDGLPLKYPREEFIKNIKEIIKDLPKNEQQQILNHFGLNKNFDGLLNNKPLEDTTISPEMKTAADKVLQEIEKFTIHNEVKIENPEVKEVLDGLVQGLPEFTSIIGKKQHETHAYSVDIHMLKVLQDIINDPAYKNLSDESKTVVKIAAIIHDIGKQSNIIDTGHQRTSAEFTLSILDKFNLSPELKQRIIDTVDNHHWFGEYNTEKMTAQEAAANCRRPEDFDIYKMLAKADLKNVNKTFHLEKTGTKSQAEFDAYIDNKMSEVQTALTELYQKAPVVLTTPILNNGKNFPTVNVMINGKSVNIRALNINELPDGQSLEQFGFTPGSTKENLTINVHMTSELDNTYNLLNSTKRLSQNHPIISSSLLRSGKIDSRGLGKCGFIIEGDISSTVDASKINTATGLGKNVKTSYFGLFADGGLGTTKGGRIGLRNYFIQNLYEKTGIKLTNEEYGILVSKHLKSVKYPSQITKDVKIGDKTIKAQDLRTALEKAQEELFKGPQDNNNEITTIDPKIKGIYAKVDKIENVPPEALEFAQKHNLPIILMAPKDAKFKPQTTITENTIRQAVDNIRKHYAQSTPSIRQDLNNAGLNQIGEMKTRIKSEQSLYDKLVNYLKDNPTATIEDAARSVKDAFGARTIAPTQDYTTHPEVKALLEKGDIQAAQIKAAELQSAPALEKLKDIILEKAQTKEGLEIARISNYVSEDGIPYFSEAQLAELKQFGAQHGVNIDYIVKVDKSDPLYSQMEAQGKKPTTRKQPSGYTALQINFKTKTGETLEWQFRGDLVNEFAEGEHIPYDLRTGKDIIGNHPELEPLYNPIKELLSKEKMPDEAYREYNRYLNDVYTHLRNRELGFSSTEPRLEDYGNGYKFDVRLKAENLIELHKIADKLKKGNITQEQALKDYSETVTFNPATDIMPETSEHTDRFTAAPTQSQAVKPKRTTEESLRLIEEMSPIKLNDIWKNNLLKYPEALNSMPLEVMKKLNVPAGYIAGWLSKWKPEFADLPFDKIDTKEKFTAYMMSLLNNPEAQNRSVKSQFHQYQLGDPRVNGTIRFFDFSSLKNADGSFDMAKVIDYFKSIKNASVVDNVLEPIKEMFEKIGDIDALAKNYPKFTKALIEIFDTGLFNNGNGIKFIESVCKNNKINETTLRQCETYLNEGGILKGGSFGELYQKSLLYNHYLNKKGCTFSKLDKITQENLMTNILKTQNNPYEQNINTVLKLLAFNIESPEVINKLCNDKKLAEKISNNFNNLEALFAYQGKIDTELKNKIKLNLALMQEFNPESFKNLKHSKGYKEIKKGSLNIKILENLKFDEVIDDNYFYNKFDRNEKTLEETLKSKTEMSDESIAIIKECVEIDPSRQDEILDWVLNARDTGFMMTSLRTAVKAVKTYEQNIEKQAKQGIIKSPAEIQKDKNAILTILEISSKNPELFKYITNFRASSFIEQANLATALKDCKLPPEQVNKLMDTFTNNYTILNASSVTTAIKLAEKIKDVDKVSAIIDHFKQFERVNFAYILGSISENNIDYVMEHLGPGKFKPHVSNLLWAVKDMPEFKNPEFQPKILEALGQVTEATGARTLYNCRQIAKMKVENPQRYEKIANSGLFELIKSGKLDARVLNNLNENADLSENMYKDLALLKAGKSIVPEFPQGTPINEAFAKTQCGDAVEIGNKMFINDGNTLVEWEMTKEKYLELFPPVSRFATVQGGLGDCYFVSSLNTLMTNPQTRAELYKSYKFDGNELSVTIKGYEEYGGTQTYENGPIPLATTRKLSGCLGLQLLEKTYAKTALRHETQDFLPKLTVPAQTVMQRITGGRPNQAISELLDYKNYGIMTAMPIGGIEKGSTVGLSTNKDIKKAEKLITDLSAENGYLLNFGTIPSKTPESPLDNRYNLVSNHAYSIISYDPATKIVKISNPHDCAAVTEIPIDILAQNISLIYITRLK